jgi:hypothetical protein
MIARKFAAIYSALTLCAVCWLAAEETTEITSDHARRRQLESVQWIVGKWRGVGQPTRGSRQGAWREECSWTWKFAANGQAALLVQAAEGKFFTSGELRPGTAPLEFAFEVHSADLKQETPRSFHGKLDDDGKLVLVDSEAPLESPARITIRTAAGGDRMLVLYEKRLPGDRYSRLAEIGYTRDGSGFGKGTSYIECVVTGGLGTIPVTHGGKTYYVCCTGCRDFFYDRPAEVIKEYQDRKAAE